MNDILICYKKIHQVLERFVSFSNMHLEVHFTNLLWIEVDLRKILISFLCLFHGRYFENGLGEAMWHQTWWRHQMETFSALLVPGEFPAQRPVTRSFDVIFDLRLNKRLRKQSCGWWFETLSGPLWRHCNVYNFDILSSYKDILQS